MNLLVTGGAGFIGSHFVEHALSHASVLRLVNLDCLTYAGDLRRLEAIKDDPRYVFEKVDLGDEANVRRVVNLHEITHVIHLAAETHVDRSIVDARAFVRTNVTGSLHLLEACRTRWVSGNSGTFVQVSTDEVYGSLEGDELSFTEDSPLAPNSPYAASKAAADCLVRSYVQTYKFPAVITRCSNNFGPGQHAEKLIPLVIHSALNRRSIPLYGDGMNVRDWLYVKDHCTALWSVLTRGIAGETYNIGAHNERANLCVVQTICDLVDELKPECAGQTRELITFVKDRAGHDRRYGIDPAKIERDLGWKPSHSFEAAMRDTVQSYVQSTSP